MESRIFSLKGKRALIDLLIASGLSRNQVGSFGHSKRMPQMADTDELIRNLGEGPGVVFTGLVLNGKGLERALACGLILTDIGTEVIKMACAPKGDDTRWPSGFDL